MIDEIHVENLALIRHATLSPCSGLTVLTGETGAGKTALLSACKLLMGERASAQMVRDGEASLSVSGRFFVRETLAGHLAEEDAAIDGASRGATGVAPRGGASAPDANATTDVAADAAFDVAAASAPDAEAPERDIVVTRRVGLDGRSRVTIDGHMASATQLAATIGPIVDLCGQHEHQRLLKPANHVAFLDAWAKEQVAGALGAYRSAFAAAGAAKKELERVQSAASSSSAQLDEARFVLRAVNEVDPEPGEYERLVESLSKAENAEALHHAAEGAYQALSGEGEEGSALNALNAAIYLLDQAARFDESLHAHAKSLRDAVYIAEDVAADVRAYRDSIDLDQAELARMQERVSAMQRLLRSYGPRMEDVLAAREKAAALVGAVDDFDSRLKTATAAVDQAEAELARAADALDEARRAVAPQFAHAVCEQMKRLCMGDAQLVCVLERQPRDAWTKNGSSTVEFMFRPGSEMAARPLARIASGGEVSRVMLALRVVLGQTDAAGTLIFDEVDAGVGGATAIALADVLADLAKTRQVLVVTHLPQVAVRAQRHYVVAKSGESHPETTIAPVEGAARVDEIARMLAGDESEAAQLHAAELLAQAQHADM